LRQLLDRFGNEVLARSLLNVVYFPYPSETFAHRKLPLGSQQYGFRLVGRAMERKAFIVSMRPGKNRYWLEAVSGLRDYAHFYSVKNPQNPAISLNNLPRGYDEVVSAIEAAERTHQRS
jgi:hypothetical protein